MVFILASCSTTSSLEDDELLYIGMKPIKYSNYDACQHASSTQGEIEAALACAPNGALFGSSYYRTPFPYGLWIWNSFSESKGGIGKWLTSNLGNPPVLISDVNPELRTTVAETVLRNNGYFRGNVTYDIIESSVGTTRNDSVPRPLKAKVEYKVDMGPLFTIDSISYVGFSEDEMKIIDSGDRLIKKGDPFSIAALDEERTRIYNALREQGYYFYQQAYSTYLADTLKVSQKVQLQLHKVDSLPDVVGKKWVMGRSLFRIRREPLEQLTDTVTRRFVTVNYAGKHSPLRPRVILPDIRLRPGDLFSQSELEESTNRLAGKGVFSSVDISFSPRYNADGSLKILTDTVSQTTRKGQDRSGAGVLDMIIDCTLDKPYNIAVQGNFIEKTSGRFGPGAGLSFIRKNALRGGENLSFDLSASVDFPIGKKGKDNAANYDLRGDITLELPRMLLPKFIKPNRRWYSMPNTIVRLSSETIKRTGFYRRNILSSELSYNFRPRENVRHTVTPLSLDYSFMASHTAKFDSIVNRSSYTEMLVQDVFIPRMRYTFSYVSPLNYRNPIGISITLTEAGNLVDAVMAIGGKRWDEPYKKLFRVPFSQFIKTEVDWRKTWTVNRNSKVLAHFYGGYIRCLGNSIVAPSSEMFYMGGANDLRGFSTRSVGPGAVHVKDRDLQYLMSLGDMKLLGNLEYRPRLFGSLYGALFLDLGNAWLTPKTFRAIPDASNRPLTQSRADATTEDGTTDNLIYQRGTISWKNFGRDIAVDAGIGIRYDLDFFVLRLDWGFIIHAPYETGHSGYFNTPHFSQAQCLNFAIGYPF